MFLKVLSNFDLATTNLINQIIPHSHIFDIFFSFFSLTGNSIFIWGLVILLLVIFEERQDKRFIVYFIITFLITGSITNFVLKPSFRRIRPAEYSKPAFASQCPNDFSFPSGHATTAFAAAATLSAFHKKRKYFFYLIATLIAFSRIYLHCHYFLDVMAGAVLGYVTSKLILVFALKKNRP